MGSPYPLACNEYVLLGRGSLIKCKNPTGVTATCPAGYQPGEGVFCTGPDGRQARKQCPTGSEITEGSNECMKLEPPTCPAGSTYYTVTQRMPAGSTPSHRTLPMCIPNSVQLVARPISELQPGTWPCAAGIDLIAFEEAAGTFKCIPIPTPASAPASAPAPPPAPSSDFNTILQRYRTALLDAKATGNVGKKVEADRYKAWLDTALMRMQGNLNTSRRQIQSFVNEYAGSTSEIEKVRRKFREVRDRGPVLQDVYETDKRMESTPIVTYDVTPIYTKALLVVGLAAVAVVVSRRI